MVRLIGFFIALCIFSPQYANAQLFRGKLFGGKLFGGSSSAYAARKAPGAKLQTKPVPNRYRTPYPSVSGFSVGVGSYPYYNYPRPGQFDPYRFDSYVHDPYATGSFRAPDLLKDPYFRERHRYDSRYPGRYQRPPLELRSTVPTLAYPSGRPPEPYETPMPYRGKPSEHFDEDGRSILRNSGPVAMPSQEGRARFAPGLLKRSLAARDDGDAWIEFLQPDRINLLIAEGDLDGLRELQMRYEGIANNPQMRSVVSASGFNETRDLFTRYVGRPIDEGQAVEPPSQSSFQQDSRDMQLGPVPAPPVQELMPPNPPEELPQPLPVPDLDSLPDDADFS